jgi:hypothetical protein
VHTHTAAIQKPGKGNRAARKKAWIESAKTGSKETRDEIYSYVAIRDLLLHDAEITTTMESLRRASIANDFVENCLRPARPPYEGQCLRQIDAAREYARCVEARNRIAQLTRKLEVT